MRSISANACQHALDMRDRRLRKDAVPQVEDERSAGKCRHHLIDRTVERFAAGHQNLGIEIALHRHARLDALRTQIFDRSPSRD